MAVIKRAYIGFNCVKELQGKKKDLLSGLSNKADALIYLKVLVFTSLERFQFYCFPPHEMYCFSVFWLYDAGCT